MPPASTSVHRAAGGAALVLGLAGCGGHSNGLSAIPGSSALVPTPVATSLRFTSLAVGLQHACGVTAGGATYCWGDDSYQQLGTSAALATCQALNGPCSPAPLVVTGGSYSSIAASLRDSCGLAANGDAWCWGYGDGGQLGDGRGTSSGTPVLVSGGLPFSAIALGGSGLISCAIGPGGSGYCWGPGGGGGGLGDGTTNGSNSPVLVAGGLSFAELAVGDEHACGATTDHDAYCWGHNLHGALGSGVPGASAVPAKVAGNLTISAISAGLVHSCALTSDGSAYCWGFAADVGTAGAVDPVLSPVAVAGGRHYTAISAGQDHTCALDATGVAWCWGANAGGELGDGTTTDRPEPVRAATNARFVAIRAGGSTCALDASGQAYCWGPNGAGQDGQPP